MVFRMIKEKAKVSRELKEIREARKVSVDWIVNNRQELLENFPNNWVAVSNGEVQLADDDIMRLYSIMEQRGGSRSMVYYCCNTYTPPMVLVRSEEVEINEFATAEA